jgi:hypothetical protein
VLCPDGGCGPPAVPRSALQAATAEVTASPWLVLVVLPEVTVVAASSAVLVLDDVSVDDVLVDVLWLVVVRTSCCGEEP